MNIHTIFILFLQRVKHLLKINAKRFININNILKLDNYKHQF